MRVKVAKSVRDPEFGKRFRKACDDSPHCPPKHAGRYNWIVSELSRRTGQPKLSIETCRKWHEGETSPSRKRIDPLAKILGVDSTWLYLGQGADGQPSVSRPDPAESQENEVKYADRMVLPVAIRPGLVIEIAGLPLDLTKAEAGKVANVILAHAS